MQHRRPLGRRENPFTKGGTRLTFKRDDRNRSLVGRGLIFAFGAIILIMYPWSRPVENSASVETPLKVATVITPNIEDADLGYKSKLTHDEEEKVPYHTPLADEEDNSIPTKADMHSESIMIEESQNLSAGNDSNENNAFSDLESKSINFSSPMKDEKEFSPRGDDDEQGKDTKTDEIKVDEEDSSVREQDPLNEIEKGETDDSVEVESSKNFQDTQVDPPQEVDNPQETDLHTKSIKDDDESGSIQTIEKNETETAFISYKDYEHKTGILDDSSNDNITSLEQSNKDSGQKTGIIDDSSNDNITSLEQSNKESGQKTGIFDDSSNDNITSSEQPNTDSGQKTGIFDDLNNENVTSFEQPNKDYGHKTGIFDDLNSENVSSFEPSNKDSGPKTGIFDDSSNDNITYFEPSNIDSGPKTGISDDLNNDNITSFEQSNIDSGQKTGLSDYLSKGKKSSFESSDRDSGPKTGTSDNLKKKENMTSFESSNRDSGLKTGKLDDSSNDNITHFDPTNRDSGPKTGISDDLNNENITSFEPSNKDSAPMTGISDDLNKENITAFEVANRDSGHKTGISGKLNKEKNASFQSLNNDSGPKTGLSDYLSKEKKTSFESSDKDSGPKTGISENLNKENITSFEPSKNIISGSSNFENRNISKVYMKSKVLPKKLVNETKLKGLSINSKINQTSDNTSEFGNSSKEKPSKKIKNLSQSIGIESNLTLNIDLKVNKSQFMGNNRTSINSSKSMLANVTDDSNVSISMNNTVEVDSFSIIGARHLNSTRKGTVHKLDQRSKEKLDFAANHALNNETSIVNETETRPMDSQIELNETEEYTEDRNTSLSLINKKENASVLSRSNNVANDTLGNPILPSSKTQQKNTKKSSNTVSPQQGKLRGPLANTTSKRKNK